MLLNSIYQYIGKNINAKGVKISLATVLRFIYNDYTHKAYVVINPVNSNLFVYYFNGREHIMVNGNLMSKSEIVTDDDIRELEEILAAVANSRKEIALAKQAGLDVSTAENELNQAEATAKALLAVYKKRTISSK